MPSCCAWAGRPGWIYCPVELDAAGIRRAHARKYLDERRLPYPVLAHQRVDFPGARYSPHPAGPNARAGAEMG